MRIYSEEGLPNFIIACFEADVLIIQGVVGHISAAKKFHVGCTSNTGLLGSGSIHADILIDKN